MKICFVGLGSIGNRHLTNLTRILTERKIKYEIHALRTTQKPLTGENDNLISKTVTSYAELDNDYDIAFVTNPTSRHYETLQKILPCTKHVFIEKPLFMDVTVNPESLPLKKNSVYYVAAPLRYNGVIPVIEKFVKENHIYSARAICSSYLPEWRKNVDYRTNYSAKKELGGGVSLDLVHEWDYLKHFFGLPTKLCYLAGTKSDLEITSDDIAVYIAEYPDKMIELHLDYFGRRATRKLELYSHGGTLTADFYAQTVTFDNGAEGIQLSVKKTDDTYVNEMNHFIDLCLGNKVKNNNDIYSAYETMKLSLGEIP